MATFDSTRGPFRHTGTQIEGLLRQASKQPGLVGMAGGLPSQNTFPRGLLLRGCQQALREGKADCLQYDWPEGRPRLRAWIVERLRRRGADVDPENVIVTNGAQEALNLSLEILKPSERSVAVAPETYPSALALFRERGWSLRRADETAGLAYVMPSIDNPRGLVMPPGQRQRLLDSGATLLEDDVYAELCFDGSPARPLLADAPARVFHVGSFSKLLCPGLRIGWLVVPARLRDQARQARAVRNLLANGFAQGVLEHVVTAFDFQARIVRLRAYYARRARRLLRALSLHLSGCRFTTPLGGFSCWVETDVVGDDARLLSLACASGVSFDPGNLFRSERRGQPVALRLSFSNLSLQDITLGVQRLSHALSAFSKGIHEAGCERQASALRTGP